MVPKTLFAAIRHWPTGDLAELLLAIKTILDQRAEHARETKRKQSKRVDRRSSK